MSTPEGGAKGPSLIERMKLEKAGPAGLAAAVNPATNNAKPEGKVLTAAEVARIRKPDVIAVPKKRSEKDVIFKSPRMHFRSALPSGEAFTFENGYLMTDRADMISYIRQNAVAWRIVEVDSK